MFWGERRSSPTHHHLSRRLYFFLIFFFVFRASGEIIYWCICSTSTATAFGRKPGCNQSIMFTATLLFFATRTSPRVLVYLLTRVCRTHGLFFFLLTHAYRQMRQRRKKKKVSRDPKRRWTGLSAGFWNNSSIISLDQDAVRLSLYPSSRRKAIRKGALLLESAYTPLS